VLSAPYQLPFDGSAWTRGWQIATIVQSQSGNPVNIVTSNATLNGVPHTVRPDLVAPIHVIGSVDRHKRARSPSRSARTTMLVRRGFLSAACRAGLAHSRHNATAGTHPADPWMQTAFSTNSPQYS